MRILPLHRPPQALRQGWTVCPEGGVTVPAAVPGCVQQDLDDRRPAGPFRYRCTFTLDDWTPGEHVTLLFGGVSYACAVQVNGAEAGRHRGVWDEFCLDVTPRARAGLNTLEVEVTRHAPLSAGPDSPHLPGPYPLRSALTGFLPYVWGDLFTGLWQDVWLIRSRAAYPHALRVQTWPDGRLTFSGLPPGAQVSAVAPGGSRQVLEPPYQVTDPQAWTSARPALYRLEVTCGEDRYGLTCAFRDLGTRGTQVWLGGEPVYPRLALSWGWTPGCLHANPGREAFRRELTRVRELGYNGVKLCLWVPPADYFELADELGMYLWLELPLWLPRLTPDEQAQVREEYRRILDGVAHHPSLMIVTLGCELDAGTDQSWLGALYDDARERLPQALIRDNSGGGEAYGGHLDEHADFWDHHFYAEVPNFTPLLDAFAPHWRRVQPWLFGEFCDSDSFRDVRKVARELGDPWWLSADPERNPQGARWQMDVHDHARRLQAWGLEARAAQLTSLSHRHSLLCRKLILERVRARGEIGGYTVTGLVDTPISTAGMWTDLGEWKFPPEEFQTFNADTVFLAAPPRRRRWQAGGDRPEPLDEYGHRPGEVFRRHVVVSHYGAGPYRQVLHVSLRGADMTLHEQVLEVQVAPGQTREVGVFQCVLPEGLPPGPLVLEVTDGERRNRWTHWLYPPLAEASALWQGAHRHDPLGYLEAPDLTGGPDARLWVSTLWDEATRQALERGAGVLLVQTTPGGPVPTRETSYWREGLPVIEEHPAWAEFPHRGEADTPFLAVTPDRSLVAPPGSQPIFTRVDARTLEVTSYAYLHRAGAGALLHTTLRLGGGLGRQPRYAWNLTGQQLLTSFLRGLARVMGRAY